jgi:hypothetical protein
MPRDPALVIRQHLEEHGGELEVSGWDLLTTWQVEEFTPDVAETIEEALRSAGVSFEPGLQGLDEDDQVSLRLAELEPPPEDAEEEPPPEDAEEEALPYDPGVLIRGYLEQHGGEVEVPARHLLTTWRIEEFTPKSERTIEEALHGVRVSVEPDLDGLGKDDRVTLRLAELEPGVEEVPEDEPPWAREESEAEEEPEDARSVAEDEHWVEEEEREPAEEEPEDEHRVEEEEPERAEEEPQDEPRAAEDEEPRSGTRKKGRLRSLLDVFGLKSPSRIAAQRRGGPDDQGRKAGS